MAEISVIVPCYNQEMYIAECLDSVIAQSFTDYEVIVVDDGSTDNSLSIIKKYADKYPAIRVLEQSNQGVVSARNHAISQALGKYIYPLDGDDKIAPDCLELLYRAMSEGKGDVIYSDNAYFGLKTGKITYLAPTKLNMILGNRISVSALYRKSDWLKYGGYDQMMKDGLEDWEFWLNFIEDRKRFYKVENCLFFYRISDKSRHASISKSLEKKLFEKIRAKHTKLFNWKFKIMIAFFNARRFVFQRKVTKSNRTIVKILKIPIYVSQVKGDSV